MDASLLGALSALMSAVSFGSGDFSGGFASRKLSEYQVLALSSPVAAIALIIAALVWNEPFPDLRNILIGSTAGIAGLFGLAFLFRGLVQGSAAVVSPVTGVLTAGVPAIYALITDGLPSILTLVGFLLALIGIWITSQSETGVSFSAQNGLGVALFAGLMFGTFILLVSFTDDIYLFWPLAFAKGIAIPILIGLLLVQRQPYPMPFAAPIALLAGILDAAGNAFYVLAQQLTRLDVAAVLSSLYPMVTVILTTLILKETVTNRQWFGVGLCVLAIVMIAG